MRSWSLLLYCLHILCFPVPSGDSADSAGEQTGSAADTGAAGEAPAPAANPQQPPTQQQVSLFGRQKKAVLIPTYSGH